VRGSVTLIHTFQSDESRCSRTTVAGRIKEPGFVVPDSTVLETRSRSYGSATGAKKYAVAAVLNWPLSVVQSV